MKLIFFLTFFSQFILSQIFFSHSAFANMEASNQCSHLKGDCEFYACMEEEYHCGRGGYPTGFGGKYCLGFTSIQNNFTSEGKEWIRKTKACLMQKILQAPDYNNCSDLREGSFADHVPCYVESGFCSLPLMDKIRVMKLIKSELFRFETIKTGLSTLYKCMPSIF